MTEPQTFGRQPPMNVLEAKTSADHLEKPVDGAVYTFKYDAAMEKRLLWKIDLRLVPVVWLMYCLNYLDRNNIGNAKTAGMQQDLDLSSSDYSLAVSIFFIGYLLLQIPSNMILAKTKPRLYLPGIMFVWGCISISYIGINTKAALYGVRFLLGVIEAGFFPGVLLYMSLWYRKMELARRFSVFYAASLVSGAFGGLLAGAILSGMNGAHGLPAWKWLFLIEGVVTVGFSLIAVFILPDFPGTTTWLTPEERAYAVARLADDNNIDTAEEQAVGHLRSIVLAAKDWRTWLFAFGQTCNTAAGTITYFVPTLIASLGYSGTMAQFMTVPIYAVAIVIVLACCFSSDFTQERPKHIMAMALLSVVSLSIVAGVTHNAHVRYAFLAFGASGIWACSPMTLSYLSNTISRPAEKRAVSIGIVNGLANLASVYGAYIWPSSSAPAYIPGFVTSTMLQFGSFVFAVAAYFLLKKYPYPVPEVEVRREPAELAWNPEDDRPLDFPSDLCFRKGLRPDATPQAEQQGLRELSGAADKVFWRGTLRAVCAGRRRTDMCDEDESAPEEDADAEADADVPVPLRAPSARLNDSKNLLLHTDRPMRIIPGVVPASLAPLSGPNQVGITQAGQPQPPQQASHPLDEIGIALAFWCIDHGVPYNQLVASDETRLKQIQPTPLPAEPALAEFEDNLMQHFVSSPDFDHLDWLDRPRLMGLYRRYRALPNSIAEDKKALILSALCLARYSQLSYRFEEGIPSASTTDLEPKRREDVTYYTQVKDTANRLNQPSVHALWALFCLVPYMYANAGPAELQEWMDMMAWQVRELGLHRLNTAALYSPEDMVGPLFAAIFYSDTLFSGLRDLKPRFPIQTIEIDPLPPSPMFPEGLRRATLLATDYFKQLADPNVDTLSDDFIAETETIWMSHLKEQRLAKFADTPRVKACWAENRFNWLRIVLYAPLLSQPNRATRAISVLIRAVSQILHTYEDLTSFDQLRPSWPQLRIITTCGQILILALAAGELQRTEATRLFGLVFDFLGRHCELWSCATELLVGFKRAAAVFDIGQDEVPPALAPTLVDTTAAITADAGLQTWNTFPLEFDPTLFFSIGLDTVAEA